ncbi:MAG: hypothetical protein LAT62_13455 [Natronospirillum sp.]|uniref:hypothetical protein n=1 Tax=Natronospirillum sp. TaxID=2812955 RepID=UPI0025D5C88C|nr:hypothetical protein [Natronospirillum sp.]MCH8552940.1 hypothetical protein [Natronospirillum sp.]
MSVHKIDFELPESVYPDEARAMVARLLDGQQADLVSTLMNYQARTGDPQVGFPRVQFGRYRRGFSMLGFAEGQQILADAAPIIHNALSNHYSVVIPVSTKTYSVQAEWRPYRLEYSIPRVVVQKKDRQKAWMNDRATGKPYLESLLVRSLRRQAEVVGVELPSAIDVAFLGADRDYGAKRKAEGGSLSAMGLINARFAVNLKLTGIWAIGYLLSKGHGHLDANMSLAGVPEDAEEINHALSE